MTLQFQTLGFACYYTVSVDPARPVPATWDAVRTHWFGRDGRHIEEFELEPRWGTPIVVRVDPRRYLSWVATFAAGGLGVVRGVYATPSPRRLCVIVDGLAYVLDVAAADGPATIAADAVVHTQVLADPQLLLLASDNGLAAIGPEGVAWTAPRLVVDDLRVLRASAEAIVCSGNIGDRMATITLTPQTGAVWGSDYR